MSDSGQDLPLNFLKSADSVIRNQSLGAATSLIDYHSSGHCLVLCSDTEEALQHVDALSPLTVTIVTIDASLERPVLQLTDEGIHIYRSPEPEISGHLGAFNVKVIDNDRTHDLAVLRVTETGCFDLVLDLLPVPLQSSRLPPFGYRHATEATAITAAVEDLRELIGEFDKPRYFDYNSEICAHERSHLTGCTRCVDICATGAISTQGEGVVVDPYLCQGCGTCATVCPTGAMTYAYPRPSDAIERTRQMRETEAPDASVLLLYKQGEDAEDEQFENGLPSHVMALAVEEITAYGIDYWAAMYNAGFAHVVIAHDLIGDSNQQNPDLAALETQAALLQTIVGELGASDQIVYLFETGPTLRERLSALQSPAVSPLPAFATHNNKRQTFRMAIDQLAQRQAPSAEAIALPAGSPFGRVEADQAKCTLCMACVSMCPAGALFDGQDAPKLRFIEANCVQCGICEKACPEDAISLTPLYRYDSVVARETEILNEEEPFNCVRCNKAFATRKMIDNMTSKLAGHWMFGDEKAMRRLKMCEDCRVIDMFEDDAGGIKVHRDA